VWRDSRGVRPIVFAGPSLSRLPAADRERIEPRPPARRGDLEALLRRPPGCAVLIDGLFGQAMAVTPTECRELISAGWTLWGASSMGALRASELWSVGMIGVGEVYTMLRSGVVMADDEVAVGYHPDTHEELTASLVHVRAILRQLEGQGAARDELMAALELARGIHWLERSWRRLLTAWRNSGLRGELLEYADRLRQDPDYHPKVKDAEYAVRAATTELWP
jgi:TfuA protein